MIEGDVEVEDAGDIKIVAGTDSVPFALSPGSVATTELEGDMVVPGTLGVADGEGVGDAVFDEVAAEDSHVLGEGLSVGAALASADGSGCSVSVTVPEVVGVHVFVGDSEGDRVRDRVRVAEVVTVALALGFCEKPPVQSHGYVQAAGSVVPPAHQLPAGHKMPVAFVEPEGHHRPGGAKQVPEHVESMFTPVVFPYIPAGQGIGGPPWQ